MIRVITYGTYDVLHYGHLQLLERAKALGDYLIVGVTADDFDKTRGKINVQQSLMERIEAIRATGIADEIIVEEYEGQKIDDIKRLNVDIFTVGSDWVGKFDYLNEYCKVMYLPRTEGVSSSGIRGEKHKLRLGLVGELQKLTKVVYETSFVNGVSIQGIYSTDPESISSAYDGKFQLWEQYSELLHSVDAVYIASHPSKHYEQIKIALLQGKHVLCESPIAELQAEYNELIKIAKDQRCILMDGIKTAFSTAYSRLLLLTKSGKIGKIVSVDATCTSLKDFYGLSDDELKDMWNTMCEWGPSAMLPIFQILGTSYIQKTIVTRSLPSFYNFDGFTKVDFIFEEAVASLKVGQCVKSEGELVISGTKGYIYVPAPWWKTDYFEVRFENPAENLGCF